MKTTESEVSGEAAKPADSPTMEDQTTLYELERQRSVIRDRVRDVVARRHTSTYIFGPRGTGKTRLVRDTLDALGEPYHYHSGHLTAMGYFDLN